MPVDWGQVSIQHLFELSLKSSQIPKLHDDNCILPPTSPKSFPANSTAEANSAAFGFLTSSAHISSKVRGIHLSGLDCIL